MKVELDSFSGRPNPVWNLTEREAAQFRSLVENLPRSSAESGIPALGYRGFIVYLPEPIRIYNGRLFGRFASARRHRADVNRDVERWLLERARGHIDPAVYDAVRDAIENR